MRAVAVVLCGNFPRAIILTVYGFWTAWRHAGALRPLNGLVLNTWPLPCSHCSSCRAISAGADLRKAHSQTVATRQPAWSRSRRLRRSRSVFSSNLACQNSLASGRRGRVRATGVAVPEAAVHETYGTEFAETLGQVCRGVYGRAGDTEVRRVWTARRRSSSGRVFLASDPCHHARTGCTVHYVCHRRSRTDPRRSTADNRTTRDVSERDSTRRDAETWYGTGRGCQPVLRSTPPPETRRLVVPAASVLPRCECHP